MKLGIVKEMKKQSKTTNSKPNHLAEALRLLPRSNPTSKELLKLTRKQRNAFIDFMIANHDVLVLNTATKEDRIIAKIFRDRAPDFNAFPV